jgi:hypothetical protein
MWDAAAVSPNKRIRQRRPAAAAARSEPSSGGYLAALIASPLNGAK